jgi:hypothetical protein
VPGRKPVDMLTFAGVKAGEKVLEFVPGRGYVTRLLAKAVGTAGLGGYGPPSSGFSQALKRIGEGRVVVNAGFTTLRNLACQQSGLRRLFRCRIYVGFQHRHSRATLGIRADRFSSPTKRL